MSRAVHVLIASLLIACGVAPAIAAVPLVVSKSQSIVWDPIDLSLLPKAVPGAQVDYTISVTNPVTQGTVAKSVVVADQIPAGTKLYVGALDPVTGGPVVFTAGIGTNLTFSFGGLNNASDSIDFSRDGGATWTYSPSADASGCDTAVTNIRVRPGGNQALLETLTVRFRTIIK